MCPELQADRRGPMGEGRGESELRREGVQSSRERMGSVAGLGIGSYGYAGGLGVGLVAAAANMDDGAVVVRLAELVD
jgi:hypothetical protein